MADGNDHSAGDVKAGQGSRLGYILGSLVVVLIGLTSVSLLVFLGPPKAGMGLAGGVRLVYEVADELPGLASAASGAAPGEVTPELLIALYRRIDPSKTKQIVVQRRASNQVEILLPAFDAPEHERIKKSVSTTGFLQFRIVANERDHVYLISRAREQAENPATRQAKLIHDEDGYPCGVWSRVSREPESGDLRLAAGSNTLRDANTGEILEVPDEHRYDDERQFARYCASLGIEALDVLLMADDGYDVTGSDLREVHLGYDEQLRPCVLFSLDEDGTRRFAELTTEFGPEQAYTRQLAIVLDNQVLAAPNLQTPITGGRARITGRFTHEEVLFFEDILQAGSLPVELKDEPLVEEEFAADPSAIQAARSMVLTALVVLALAWLFMLARYRGFGVAGVLASAAQLAMTLAILAVLVAFDHASILTLAIGALVVAACNAFVCEFIRTASGLAVVCFVAASFLALALVARGIYMFGGFELRNIALVIQATGLAAVLVHTFQWLLPAAGQRLLHRAS